MTPMTPIPPVTRLYVRLRPDEIRQLGDDARKARRPVADHAAWLIARALAERQQPTEHREVSMI